MVHEKVWNTAGGPERGYLCIGCLESRLGRLLHKGDFTGAPINDLGFGRKSWRLLDRLRRSIERHRPPAVNPDQLDLWNEAA